MSRSRPRWKRRRSNRYGDSRSRFRTWSWVAAGLAGAVLIGALVASNLGGSAAPVSREDRVLGSATAPVTVIEYGDFKCPFCTRFHVQTESQLRSRYVDTGLIRFVWRDFPNIDTESRIVAEAGRCAQAQGAFWQFHDAAYEFIWNTYYGQGVNVEGRPAYSGHLDELARQASLNVEQFRSCRDHGTYQDAVNQELQSGQSRGVRGTPTFFVGDQRVVGAQPFEVFSQLIDSQLPRP